MIQLLILGILLAIVFYGIHEFLKAAPSRFAGLIRKGMLWIALGLLVALAATGRLGWLIPLIGALIAGMLRLAPLLLQFAPLLRRMWRRPNTGEGGASHDTSGASMSAGEAYEMLGLSPGASREQIIAAHRRLMQKLHPDRGGSDYLAAKINQARDTLLSR